MRVICIEEDKTQTLCTRTLKVIPTVPCPKKGEILEVIETIRQINGVLTYSFKEYNTFFETNYYECIYFKPIDEFLVNELCNELEQEMQHEFEELVKK